MRPESPMMSGRSSAAACAKRAGRDVHPEVGDREAEAAQGRHDDVLADVVDVTGHRPQQDAARGLAGQFLLQPGLGHLEHLAEDLARQDQPRQVVLMAFVPFADDAHGLLADLHERERPYAVSEGLAGEVERGLLVEFHQCFAEALEAVGAPVVGVAPVIGPHPGECAGSTGRPGTGTSPS